MSPVIGLMLPFVAGVALSPIPIAAVILMVLSLHPGIGGRVFVIGWALGLLLAVVVLSLVIGLLGLASEGRSGPARIVLGALSLVFALERATAGRGAGYDPDAPAWVAGLDRLPADRAFAMGVVQAALDPRKMLLIAAVAMVFTAAHLAPVESVISALLFCVIGSLGVAAPLLVSRRAGSAGRARLEAARTRLVEDNTTIQAVTLLILGALLVGQGLAGL
ncbi:MAG: GAP family protein [Candidatus Limnocylindrales bacterium]